MLAGLPISQDLSLLTLVVALFGKISRIEKKATKKTLTAQTHRTNIPRIERHLGTEVKSS
jgi:hypothetical protein